MSDALKISMKLHMYELKYPLTYIILAAYVEKSYNRYGLN